MRRGRVVLCRAAGVDRGHQRASIMAVTRGQAIIIISTWLPERGKEQRGMGTERKIWWNCFIQVSLFLLIWELLNDLFTFCEVTVYYEENVPVYECLYYRF